MKSALVIWSCLSILLLIGVSANAQQSPQAPVSGAWAGSLAVGGNTLHIVIHFAPKPDGSLTATFDSPDQGASGISFSAATETGDTIHLQAAAIGASFDGTLDATGKTIAGHWMQGGASLPLSVTKTDHAPVAVSHPQEPKPPFPYVSRDVTFPGGAPGVTLAGTLTLPPGNGPFPAIVLIAGSGPENRDETVLGHKPFLLLADTLTRRGVAVLRYDKRGIDESTGSYAQATSADFAADAYAAVKYLKAAPAIDPKRIGLLGHSEGGLIAPMIAAAHPSDIAFMILLAAPALPGEKILLEQGDLIARADGATPAEVAQSDAVQRQLFTIVHNNRNPAVVQAKAQAAILRAVSALSPADKAQLGNPEIYAKAQSKPLSSPWFRYFLSYDPLPALRKTRCPVLALDGSKDLQVPPAEDLAEIGQALRDGGNSKVTIKELPDLNHLFQTCKTGSPSEYAAIEETIAPVALTTISDWVVNQTGLAALR